MKNRLSDLNGHLFTALERLNDEDLTEEQLNKEISRAREVSLLAVQVIASANVSLQAMKFLVDAGADYSKCESVVMQITGGTESG